MTTTTIDQLRDQVGGEPTNQVVERLRRFAFIPQGVIGNLAAQALNEEWGQSHIVLEKYLAVHVPWSIAQGRVSFGEGQFYMTAGHLQTRYGTPLYLAFEANSQPGRRPWVLKYAGSRVSAPELPTPPTIPSPPDLPSSAEVVMMHDHILRDNADRVPFLGQTPPVAQMCAVAGAIQWSLNRGLQLPYYYFDRMSYLVPLYLQSREDITRAPDLVAPVQVNPDNLLVRTVLLPHMPYANARVGVQRHDKLPTWLLDAWRDHAASVSEVQIDDPEDEASPEPGQPEA